MLGNDNITLTVRFKSLQVDDHVAVKGIESSGQLETFKTLKHNSMLYKWSAVRQTKQPTFLEQREKSGISETGGGLEAVSWRKKEGQVTGKKWEGREHREGRTTTHTSGND